MHNPYAAPGIPDEPGAGECHPQHRALLAKFIRQRLDQPRADPEPLAIFDQLASTQDPVVRFVWTELAQVYDDEDDVLCFESKAEWDYLQRLLLLLDSDCGIQIEREWRWSWTQGVAALALVGYLMLALRLGWGHHLWLVAMPFGGISMAIAWLRRRTEQAEQGAYDPILAPFKTFGDLRTAWSRAFRFRKRQAPDSLHSAAPRSPLGDTLFQSSLSIVAHLIWLALAPYVLAIQSLPARRSLVRVLDRHSAPS